MEKVTSIFVPEYCSVAMALVSTLLMVYVNWLICSFIFLSMCIYVTASVGKFSACAWSVSSTIGSWLRRADFCSSANSIETLTWHESAALPIAVACIGPKKAQAILVEFWDDEEFVSRYALATADCCKLIFVKNGRTW